MGILVHATPDDLVDGDRRGAEQFFHPGTDILIGIDRIDRRFVIESRTRARNAAADRPKGLQDIRRILDQRCAVADQLVAALGPRIERGARDRHHLPARFRREPGGD